METEEVEISAHVCAQGLLVGFRMTNTMQKMVKFIFDCLYHDMTLGRILLLTNRHRVAQYRDIVDHISRPWWFAVVTGTTQIHNDGSR